jgi:hypothetical protein
VDDKRLLSFAGLDPSFHESWVYLAAVVEEGSLVVVEEDGIEWQMYFVGNFVVLVAVALPEGLFAVAKERQPWMGVLLVLLEALLFPSFVE